MLSALFLPNVTLVFDQLDVVLPLTSGKIRTGER